MQYLTLLLRLVQLVTMIMKKLERNRIISETEQIERARIVLQINNSLAEAARVSTILQGMTEKELDKYVQDKGWYRD